MPTGKTSLDKGHDHGFAISLSGQGHTTLNAHGSNHSNAGGTIPLGTDSHDHRIVAGRVMPAVGADGTLHVHEIPVKLTENGYESA